MPEPRDLTAIIWEASRRLETRNAPTVADGVLAAHFPETVASAESEGAGVFLRRGFVDHVTRVLKSANDDTGQGDLGEIHPSFRPLVRELKSNSYYVEALAEQVSVPRLIAAPDLLNDARRFMRRKGNECLEEAVRLDRLYAAVVEAAA